MINNAVEDPYHSDGIPCFPDYNDSNISKRSLSDDGEMVGEGEDPLAMLGPYRDDVSKEILEDMYADEGVDAINVKQKDEIVAEYVRISERRMVSSLLGGEAANSACGRLGQANIGASTFDSIKKKRKLYFLWLCIGLVFLMFVIIFSLILIQKKKNTGQQQEQLRLDFNALMDKLMPISGAPLFDPNSVQFKAMEWVERNYGAAMEDASVEETYVVALLWFATNGRDWSRQANFLNPSVSICGWNFGRGVAGGIHCEPKTHSVRQITLNRFNLQGNIPKELQYLSNLEFFYARTNKLTGSIPLQIGSFQSSMVRFEVKNNELTGSIPTLFSRLQHLEHLNLSRNKFTGQIPSELGELSKLQSLSLQDNSLVGSIPSELGRISSLKNFTLAQNHLTGTFPIEMGDLYDLREVRLGRNNIRGDLNSIFCESSFTNNANNTKKSGTSTSNNAANNGLAFPSLLFVEADSCMGRNRSKPKVSCSCCCCSVRDCGL